MNICPITYYFNMPMLLANAVIGGRNSLGRYNSRAEIRRKRNGTPLALVDVARPISDDRLTKIVIEITDSEYKVERFSTVVVIIISHSIRLHI